MAFITRHQPTADQISLALDKGYVLVSVGDMDAFTVTPNQVAALGNFDAVCVVHPAAALRLTQQYTVGVFENAMRPVEGGAPIFEAKALHIYCPSKEDFTQ
jgi:hypothetical protein